MLFPLWHLTRKPVTAAGRSRTEVLFYCGYRGDRGAIGRIALDEIKFRNSMSHAPYGRWRKSVATSNDRDFAEKTREELMPRGVAVNQRISTRDVSRVVWGLFVARVCGRDTQDRVVSLVVHSRPTAQARSIVRSRQHTHTECHHGGAEGAVDPVTRGEKTVANRMVRKQRRDQREPCPLQQHDPCAVDQQGRQR